MGMHYDPNPPNFSLFFFKDRITPNQTHLLCSSNIESHVIFLIFKNQLFENFVQCVLIVFILLPHFLSDPPCSLPTQLTLCPLFFFNSTSICTTHTFMDMLLSTGTWLSSQGLHSKEDWKCSLSQKLSIANSSSARDGASCPSPFSMLGFWSG